MNNEPQILKIKIKDDKIKNLKNRTEKHYYENILKSLKIDNEYYKMNYDSFKKKKKFMIISAILIGVGGLSVGSYDYIWRSYIGYRG